MATHNLNDDDLKKIAAALSIYKSLPEDTRKDVDDMVTFIIDPATDKDDVFHSLNTLEFILYPPIACDRAAKLIEALPAKHRMRWCESVGPCACMGCANKSGVTKSEWRRWGKNKGYKLSAWGNLLEAPGDEEEAGTLSVRLRSVPDVMKKIAVIKELRAQFDMSLMEAKTAVDQTPCIIAQELPRERAERLKFKLESLGAVIDLG